MNFAVIDKTTGRAPDLRNLAREEEWGKGLAYCDMEGFALSDDGTLYLLDECGNWVYPPADRFEIVWYKGDKAVHLEDCDVRDYNLEGIQKLCNCGVDLTVKRLVALVRFLAKYQERLNALRRELMSLSDSECNKGLSWMKWPVVHTDKRRYQLRLIGEGSFDMELVKDALDMLAEKDSKKQEVMPGA